MKRIVRNFIFIISAILLLSGCTVDYNLSIDSDFINENISFIENDMSKLDTIRTYGTFWMDDISYRDLINEYMKMNIASMRDNKSFYDKQLISDNGIGMSLNYKFNLENYQNSKSVYNCYKYFNVSNTDDTYTISTSKDFLCFNEDYPLLEQVNVNITTKYKVLETNATIIDGDTYSWVINKRNAENSQIIIKFQTKSNNIFDNIITDDNKFLLIILGVLGVIGIIIVSYVYLKSRKNNKI
ncbi:MAG: hypothetical protein V8Q75_05025 [Bacilli bacterium]